MDQSLVSAGHSVVTPRETAPVRPLRVLYVEVNEDGTVGGSHQALYDLARSLPRDRFDPVVLFYQDNPFSTRLRAEGVQVLTYDRPRAAERAIYMTRGAVYRRLEHVRAIVRRYRLLQRERIDLLHLNNGPTIGVDDWLPAALLARIPCIVNAMGLAHRQRRVLKRILSRRFERVLAISGYMERALCERGFPPNKIVTIPLAVDLGEFRERVRTPRNDVRAKLGVPPHALLVTMVGNIRRWKGQHVLLDALKHMPPDVLARLRVRFAGAASAGDRDYMVHLSDTVAAYGLGDIVEFLGPRNDVPDLLAASDIAVHASVLPEPFGLVIIEAMALGTPVVAARLGGPAEIITASSGLLFDPTEPSELAGCLSRLVCEPSLRRALAQGARARAEDFGLARHVDAMIAQYDDIVTRRRSR